MFYSKGKKRKEKGKEGKGGTGREKREREEQAKNLTLSRLEYIPLCYTSFYF